MIRVERDILIIILKIRKCIFSENGKEYWDSGEGNWIFE